MPANLVCVVCGGKDFYSEAGFYFCNECQTQTQELREQVFDQQDNTAFLRVTKTTVRKEKSLIQTKLTSWEIFNHILYGLVEEMNVLGVNNDFKEVCYHLWIQYLTKLEIMTKIEDGLPKLNACFRRRDAEIVYNRKFTKTKRKRSKSADSIISSLNSANDLDMRLINRERAKQRRKLVRSEYDEYSNTKSSDTSLHNQTLSGLGSDDDDSSSTNRLIFTKSARKELLKIMTKTHLNLHLNDVENNMKCHKFNTNTVGQSYIKSHVLTKNKLYSVIYLALLLTQDKYQLSDIIRFCREGHLSYLEYEHFFPDVMSDDCIDKSVYLKGLQTAFSYENLQNLTLDIYHKLELKPCDFSPDLIELCKRYCTELNLPDEIFNIAANYINETKPKFPINKKTKHFPNYEGRTMAFIVFTLKVLFCLDGPTEYEFSTFAQQINKKQKEHMFVFDEWYNYIQYRKLVLKNTHFPTKFLYEPNCRDSIDLYVRFMQQKKQNNDLEETATLSMKIAKKYLIDLEMYQSNMIDKMIEFKPSVTPFRSYIDLLKTIENFTINEVPIKQNILKDRSKDSVDFLIHCSSYVKLIKTSKCQMIQSGKNTNFVFHKMRKNLEKDLPDILKIYEMRWYKSFEKQKQEILQFDNLLFKLLDKQIDKVKNKVTPMNERLNQSERIIKYVDQKQIAIKNNVGRNSKGKFCKKDSAENMTHDHFAPKNKNKWFVSSWIENPALKEHHYNPSLLYELSLEQKNTSNKKQGRKSNETIVIDNEIKNKNMHYIPWLEYWVNIKEINNHMSAEKWEQFSCTLPKNFIWLLGECATIIEQKPIELFAEFVNVELYMCYVHLNNTPVLNKSHDNYKSIMKIIQRIKSVW